MHNAEHILCALNRKQGLKFSCESTTIIEKWIFISAEIMRISLQHHVGSSRSCHLTSVTYLDPLSLLVFSNKTFQLRSWVFSHYTYLLLIFNLNIQHHKTGANMSYLVVIIKTILFYVHHFITVFFLASQNLYDIDLVGSAKYEIALHENANLFSLLRHHPRLPT
jgi:hypothetical protein